MVFQESSGLAQKESTTHIYKCIDTSIDKIYMNVYLYEY
jgi:hypothetical protein